MLSFDIPSADTMKKQATVGNGRDGQQSFGHYKKKKSAFQWATSPQNISSIYSTYWWCGDVITCTKIGHVPFQASASLAGEHA